METIENNLASVEWSLTRKFAFRFFFIFFISYILLNPDAIIPYSNYIYTHYLIRCNKLIAWFTIDILHLASPGVDHSISTIDNTFGYLSLFFIVSIAILGSVIWTIIDRKTKNENRLYHLLITVLRYFLAAMWIAYGALKITRLQFPPLTPDTLIQTYGNSSPRELAWAFMGYSNGFNYFIGTVEIIAGLLLFFRRTSLIGNLIAFGALVNVIAFDYFFDVNVKMLASVLMLMTLFLLSKDITRLVNFFLFNKVTEQNNEPFYRFKNERKNTALIIFKCVFMIYLIISDLYVGFATVNKKGAGNQKPPLYGIYEVKTFIRNKDTIKSSADTNRWDKLIISLPGHAGIVFADNSLKHFVFHPDTINKKIEMYAEDDTTNKAFFGYTLSKTGVLAIQGKWRSDSLKIEFQQQNLSKLPLTGHHFRWVINPPKAKK